MASEPATRQEESESDASESDEPNVTGRSPLLASTNQWQQRKQSLVSGGGMDIGKNMTSMQEFSEEHSARERKIQEAQREAMMQQLYRMNK